MVRVAITISASCAPYRGFPAMNAFISDVAARRVGFFRVVRCALGFVVAGAAAQTVPSGTTPAVAREEIAALRTEVARHDALYHRQAAPEISDGDYDGLKRKLREWEQTYPEIAREVPAVAEVGDDRSGLFQTYRHRERMMSLEKAYTEAELRAFSARVEKAVGKRELAFVVEPKFDGLAVSVTFEQGRLVRAVTRGNGVEGDDVTGHVLAITGLPRTLRVPGQGAGAGVMPATIEVRGEVYVPFAEFQRVNVEREAAGETRFANPRNLAAGTLRQLDASEVTRRGLAVVFYGIGACEPTAARPTTQRGLHEKIRAWGLPGVSDVWPAIGADGVWRAVQAVERARAGFAFPTDGAVVKLDEGAAQRELGFGESAPRWAVAYKFAPARAETRLRAITIQVGRTGVLTPVAELEPVVLAGSTVARATLHNRDEIARRDLRVGDFVYVEKAGEIIPALAGVNRTRRPAEAVPFVFPTACPACGTGVVQRTGEVAVRCPGAACPAQLRRRIEHFASKAGVDIEGLGPAMSDALVDRGVVKELADLYRLRREDLVAPGKNAGKAAERLLAAIAGSKRAELARVIYALGIPQVGAVAARELARECGSLAAVAALGEKTPAAGASAAVRAAAAHFAEPRNRARVTELIAAGLRPTGAEAGVAGRALAGKTFVLTGTLPTLSRAQATAKIEAAGGRVSASVSARTDYVVVGTEAGVKLEQARTLQVPVIAEAELLRLIEEK
jgi:DNA ligase (NAD+)